MQSSLGAAFGGLYCAAQVGLFVGRKGEVLDARPLPPEHAMGAASSLFYGDEADAGAAADTALEMQEQPPADAGGEIADVESPRAGTDASALTTQAATLVAQLTDELALGGAEKLATLAALLTADGAYDANVDDTVSSVVRLPH